MIRPSDCHRRPGGSRSIERSVERLQASTIPQTWQPPPIAGADRRVRGMRCRLCREARGRGLAAVWQARAAPGLGRRRCGCLVRLIDGRLRNSLVSPAAPARAGWPSPAVSVCVDITESSASRCRAGSIITGIALSSCPSPPSCPAYDRRCPGPRANLRLVNLEGSAIDHSGQERGLSGGSDGPWSR